MISQPCSCCHGTGRVEALETSFSKIERELCRLLVRAFFLPLLDWLFHFDFAYWNWGTASVRSVYIYIYTDIKGHHHDSFDMSLFSVLFSHSSTRIFIFWFSYSCFSLPVNDGQETWCWEFCFVAKIYSESWSIHV